MKIFPRALRQRRFPNQASNFHIFFANMSVSSADTGIYRVRYRACGESRGVAGGTRVRRPRASLLLTSEPPPFCHSLPHSLRTICGLAMLHLPGKYTVGSLVPIYGTTQWCERNLDKFYESNIFVWVHYYWKRNIIMFFTLKSCLISRSITVRCGHYWEGCLYWLAQVF